MRTQTRETMPFLICSKTLATTQQESITLSVAHIEGDTISTRDVTLSTPMDHNAVEILDLGTFHRLRFVINQWLATTGQALVAPLPREDTPRNKMIVMGAIASLHHDPHHPPVYCQICPSLLRRENRAKFRT